MHSPTADDRAHLARDKYDGDASRITRSDEQRLANGEPLAYVIGWVPFLHTRIRLDSHPLIPRVETEWWTERLIERLKERFGDSPFHLLDLCAGSGCIGIAVLHALPNSRVTFAELVPEHIQSIYRSLGDNGIDPARASLFAGNLFNALPERTRFDVIATNPPYIPSDRTLPESVIAHEPHEALFGGTEGTDLIALIARHAPDYLTAGGELWMECDISNIDTASKQLIEGGATSSEILEDQFGRPRTVLAFYQ